MTAPPTKPCENCGKVFAKPPNVSRANWPKRRACSMDCRNALLRGRKLSPKHRRNIATGATGRPVSEATRERISRSNLEHFAAHPRPRGYKRDPAIGERVSQALYRGGRKPWPKDRCREKLQRYRAQLAAAFVEDVNPLVLLDRDRGRCGVCGGVVDSMDFHVDHVVPLSRGGEHSYANTQVAHPLCNARKGTRLMEELEVNS